MNVTLTIFLLISILSICAGQNENEYDVIIMGAGMSGISAANTLYENNITNILIIEAQDYIGGRTKTVNFTGYGLNRGASWISGVCINDDNNNKSKCSYDGHIPNETNPMFEYAVKYNISYVVSDYGDNIFILDFGGQQHNKTNTENTWNKWDEVQVCVQNLIKNITKNRLNDMSYFAALYLCGWKQPLNTFDKTTEWNFFTFEYSQHAKWASVYGTKCHSCYAYGTDHLFITDPRGYQGITLELAKPFVDANRVLLSSPINTIEYDENGVNVTLDNNQQYRAKYGVVTFSLGVMQSDIVQFKPALPGWKTDALLIHEFTDYIAIYIKWPHRFWEGIIPLNASTIYLNDKRYGYFTWVYNLDHPSLFPGSLIWRLDIVTDLADLVSNENLNDTITQIIDLKLSHYFDVVPDPVDIYVASWNDNKYIQGSFANWPIQLTHEILDRMNWNLKRRLFFAGEAYQVDEGFVHGAYLSGQKKANEILSCMGVTNGVNAECPQEYKPDEDVDACSKTEDDTILEEYAWLWIIIGVIFGMILGAFISRHYYHCRKDDSVEQLMNYGTVIDNEDPNINPSEVNVAMSVPQTND